MSRTKIFKKTPDNTDNNVKNKLMDFNADLFEPLLSMVIFSGNPWVPIAFGVSTYPGTELPIKQPITMPLLPAFSLV
jgi:hypothetical protein